MDVPVPQTSGGPTNNDTEMTEEQHRPTDGGKAKRLGFLISELPYEQQRALLGPSKKRKRIRIRLEEVEED